MSNLELEEEIIIGKRGEIIPKKSLRKFSGLNPGDRVVVKATPNGLQIQKILSIDEIFNLPKITHGTPAELEQEIDEESDEHEKSVD